MSAEPPRIFVTSPSGGAYRGKAGCQNIRCTRGPGWPERCYGWHCILCDEPSNSQGDCSNPNCPHPPYRPVSVTTIA